MLESSQLGGRGCNVHVHILYRKGKWDMFFSLSCLDNCLYARAKRMMGNERPCDLCVLLDYAILADTLL